jgi:hypothetical protein
VQVDVQGFSMHVLLVQVWVSVQQPVPLVEALAMRQGLSSIMMQVCSLRHTGGGGGGGQPPMRGSLWQSKTVSQITPFSEIGRSGDAQVDLLPARAALRETPSRTERILKSIMILFFSRAIFE